MTFDGNDQAAGRGRNSRTGHKSMDNDDNKVLLKVRGQTDEHDKALWEVKLEDQKDEVCILFRNRFESTDGVKFVEVWGPTPRVRETIIWQLVQTRSKELRWESALFNKEDLHFPALDMNRLKD